MKNKITIGLFVDSFFPMVDGVATVVDNYAKRLSEKTNVIVFAPKYKQEYDDDKLSYKVVRCRSFLKNNEVKYPSPSLVKNVYRKVWLNL